MQGVKATRLKITNYRGVEELDAPIGASGALVVGENGGGKTSVLKAFRAALLGRDCAPDAIRLGADRSEILVDLGHVTVSRLITPEKTSLKVLRDGKSVSSPQRFLNELLGTSPLDPIDLYAADAKTRRATILSALPVVVTKAHVDRWLPEPWARALVEHVALDNRHGLEVVEEIRKIFYARRTAANAEAKVAREALAALERVEPQAPPFAPPLATAEAEVNAAAQAIRDLGQRAARAEAAAKRTEDSRARVDMLRRGAVDKRYERDAKAVDPDEMARAVSDREQRNAACNAAHAAMVAAQKAFENAQADERAAVDRVHELERLNEHAAMLEDQAKDLEGQATELQRLLASTTEQPPTEADWEGAHKAKAAADIRVADARAAAVRDEHIAKQDVARAVAREKSDAAGRLDTIVDTWTNAVPAALLAESNGIPGLTIGEDDILLDGVSIVNGLSGREQLRLAIEISRRANAKSKILVVDGLERVDPAHMVEFVREATRDGYQLIGTRVADGAVQLEAISLTDEPTMTLEAPHATA